MGWVSRDKGAVVVYSQFGEAATMQGNVRKRFACDVDSEGFFFFFFFQRYIKRKPFIFIYFGGGALMERQSTPWVWLFMQLAS